MKTLCAVRGFRTLVVALVTALAASAAASAHAGAHGGGGHGGGFGLHGGGGFHAGYGHRGGFAGRYGDWYGGYGYGGWGWPGYALFLATLPYDYSTYWWDSVPYYADDSYYPLDSSVGEYEGANPPSAVLAQPSAQPTTTELFAYPKNGQSTDLQAQDKQQCKSWAQSHMASGPAQPQEYLRAQAACLQGRGYSVK